MSAPVTAAMVLIMQFGVCLGLVLAVYERDTTPTVVCAAAVLVLGRVSVQLVSESVRSVRATYDRKG